jgi:bifunctional DNA-binding transcriptional regulator/antitoxin component of YhaV-PrlF toxin-antitoxin module
MTLPAKVREALGISGRSQLAVEVIDDQVRLRPTVVIPREDAWAYTKQHMEMVRRALADVEAARDRTLTAEELATFEAL